MNNNLTLKLKIDADGKAASAQIVAVGDAAEGTGKDIDGASKAAGRLTTAMAGFVSTAAVAAYLNNAARASLEFHAGLDEVSTLLDGNIGSEMDRLTQSAKDQAIAYGSFPIDQVGAQYDIISAGASNAAEATDTLHASNRLAIGGVTQIGIAADGLTSTLNAYGDKVSGATEVSDGMFVAMKRGKTTIGELASNIGSVAPLAESAGVSLDELLSATAALTKGGVSTSKSLTGVQAIIASIIKPTQEASDMAGELGLQFDAEALASQGLAGFLEELKEKTGGNTEAMAQLFGGVEALTPALALVGKSGDSFNSILEDMKHKAGATDEAFDKIASGSAFQLKQIAARLTVESIELGDSLLNNLNPAISYVNDNFDDLVDLAKTAATSVALLLGARAVSPVLMKMGGAVMTVNAASVTLTGTLGLLKGALRLVGGPIGVVIAAVGGLTMAIADAREESRKYTEDYQNGVADIFQPEKGSTYLDQLNSNLTTIEASMAKIAKTSGTTSAAYLAQAKVADNLRQLIGKTTKATDAQTTATKEGTKATEAGAKAAADLITKEKARTTEAMKTYKELNKVEAAQTDYNTKLKDLDLLLGKNKISTNQYEVAQGELKKKLDDATGATKRMEEETRNLEQAQRDAEQAAADQARQLQSITDRLNPAEAAAREYRMELQLLQNQAAEGDAMAAQSIGKLAEEYQTTQQRIAKSAAEMAAASDPVYKAWTDMGTGVQQGLSGMLDGSIKSFGDFADSMEGQLKSMLAKMASQWISSSFTKMVGGQGQAGNPMSSLTSMFAGGSPAPGSQVAMLAEQTAGMDGGSFGSAGNAAMAAAGPIGIALAINSMLTPVIEKKLGRDAGNGMKYGGLSGAFAGKVLGFGSRKQTDSGVTLDYSGGEIAGQDYKRWKKKKWGRSKRWIDYSDMDSGLEDSLNDTMDEMEQGITRFAENLGKSATSQLESFSTSTKLSLKGMDEEEAQAAIEGWVQETGGQMLKAVMPNLTGMIDGAGERVGEMVNSLLTVSDFIAMDFAPAAQVSLWDAAKQQLGSLNEIVTQFDGSVDAANEMASQAQLASAAMVQVVSYIDGAQAQISGMLGQTYDSIWQDTQSSGELYNHYLSEAKFIAEQMEREVDPEKITQASVEFDEAVKKAYANLSSTYADELDSRQGIFDNELEKLLAMAEGDARKEELFRTSIDEKREAFSADIANQEQAAREGFLTMIDSFRTTSTSKLEEFRNEIIADKDAASATIEAKLDTVAANLQATTENLNNASGNINNAAVNINTASNNLVLAGSLTGSYSLDNWG